MTSQFIILTVCYLLAGYLGSILFVRLGWKFANEDDYFFIGCATVLWGLMLPMGITMLIVRKITIILVGGGNNDR